MEFMDQMNLFEDPLGLTTDLFVDDLGTEGSILDFGLDGGLKHQSATQESLEDLLLTDTPADSLGEEWMETVDFQNLLNTDRGCENAPVAIKVEKSEPRPEGMKQAAFDILKALLTGQQTAKTEISLDLLKPVEKDLHVEAVAAISPVAEVPDIDFPTFDSINMLLGGVDNQVIHSFEDLIQPEVSLDNGDVIELQPLQSGQNFSLDSSVEAPVLLLQDNFKTESLSVSSFCDADVESILSSGPTSPSDTCQDMSTIDTSYFSDSSSQSSSAKSIQVSSEDFTKLKSKSKKNKSKSSPYDSHKVSDKRLRKKVQNKNAATRYREKKRQEKETLQEQEVRLSDTNKAP